MKAERHSSVVSALMFLVIFIVSQDIVGHTGQGILNLNPCEVVEEDGGLREYDNAVNLLLDVIRYSCPSIKAESMSFGYKEVDRSA